MGSILDSLGSLWNNIASSGEVVFHSMEDATSHLGGLGVPAFSSLEQFVQFLVSEGENPFTFLPQVVSTINSRGGNPAQVLEELAWGFIAEGPVPFTQKQLMKKINPVLNGLNQHTQVAHTVASVHQDTITQVQQKLTVLRQGSNGSLGMQGDAALAMDTHFATLHSNVMRLSAPLAAPSSASTGASWSEFEGSVGRANHELGTALENVSPWGVAGFILLDLAIIVVFCVVDVGAGLVSLGIADVALVPLEETAFSALVLAELQILGLWVPLTRWLFEILLAVDVLVREEILAPTVSIPTVTPDPTPPPKPKWWPWPDPIPPDLSGRSTPDRDDCLRKINEVKAKFPDVRADLIHYLVCLEPAMTPQEVIDLFTLWTSKGMSQQDINNLIDRLTHLRLPARNNQPLRKDIIDFLLTQRNDISDIWQKYQQIQSIPNADFILHDMIIGPDTKYRGSYFQLNWVEAHQSQVARIEYLGVDGKQGADALLINNTLVDTKSYIWAKQEWPLKMGIPQKEIQKQIERYMTEPNFAGKPVVYVFNSEGGTIPASIATVFADAKAKGLNVTVEYWPNSHPPQIVP